MKKWVSFSTVWQGYFLQIWESVHLFGRGIPLPGICSQCSWIREGREQDTLGRLWWYSFYGYDWCWTQKGYFSTVLYEKEARDPYFQLGNHPISRCSPPVEISLLLKALPVMKTSCLKTKQDHFKSIGGVQEKLHKLKTSVSLFSILTVIHFFQSNVARVGPLLW